MKVSMPKAPLVSIIIPVDNSTEYIEAALSCVTDQKYGRLEIIVINDGSTDSSEDIILRFAENDPRIIYKKTENRGPSAARNTGIDIARGSFISFVDADDLVSDEYIRSMIAQIAPSDVCVCKKVRWNQHTGRSTVDGWKDCYGTKYDLKRHRLEYQRSMRGVTGRLFKTSIIRDNNVRFIEGMNYGEDMHFNYKYFKYIDEAMFIDEALYTYRIHNKQSLTSQDHTFFLKQWSAQRRCIKDTFG